MPHPLRVLCAVHHTLAPYQPDVRPSLGDALAIHAERGARAPTKVREALGAAPWCAAVLLVDHALGAAEVATLHRELPASTAVVRGDFDIDSRALIGAIRARGAPTTADLQAYLGRRRLPHALIGTVEEVLRLPDTDTDTDTDTDAANLPSRRRKLNRHLAEFGPLRVGHWRRLVRLLALTEVTFMAGVDQAAWSAGLDPRTLRQWAAELLGVELWAAAACPGWEWKLEAMLRRFGYSPWAGETRRRSGPLARPLLATA